MKITFYYIFLELISIGEMYMYIYNVRIGIQFTFF